MPLTRLVPAGFVRLIAAISGACLIVVVVMGLMLGSDRVGTAFDQNVYWAVYKQFVGERGMLRAMLVPTEPVLLVVVVGLIVMAAVARQRPRLAILAVAGPLVTVTLTSAVLKPLFGRTINNGSLAFPSGHTSGLVAVLTVLVIAVVSGARPPWRKSLTTLAIVGAGLVAVVGATALVGMKYHYVTDTVGGACMAVGVVLLAALTIDWMADRRRQTSAGREQPVTSGVAL
ncbi:MAG: phosphatase PAP2 family protein [Kibdelosporangium sp.]